MKATLPSVAELLAVSLLGLTLGSRIGVAAPAAQPAGAVTWAGHIAPVLYANCTSCHHPGGAGPFSLLTYRDAVRWGTQVATVTQSRYMPPWLPEHQGGAFLDERRLTAGQIAEIARWVKASMPEGDAAVAPVAPVYRSTWQHGTPDLILKVEHPFLLPAGGTDVFRNFVLPYPLKVSHTIAAVEIRPRAPEIVHHANILIDRTASFRRQHPQDWEQGVAGMEVEIDAGNTFDPDAHFLFWKPDSPVLVEPKGMEWRLDPGNDLVLNMHLKPSGKAEMVSAEIGLYFTDAMPAKQPMLLQLEHDRALNIPAGVRDFVVEDSLKLPLDVELLGIYPHAHYLGKRLEAWAILPGGQRETLITIPDWDIDRQSVYRYREPMLLPAGTVVHMHYVYDNSAENVHNPHSPPARVVAGNRSEDEMAHLWLQVLPVHTNAGAPDPRLVLEEAWMRSRLAKEPGDTIAQYDLAASLAGERRFGDAIAAYEQLLVGHAGDARALNSLGATYESEGEWQKAEASYAQAIAAHPESRDATCDARFNLARLDLGHGQAGAAEAQFRAMLAGCPEDAAANDGLGAALVALSRPAEAEAAFRRALALDPADFTALYNLGALALEAGSAGEAAALLEAAVKQKPDDPESHQQLAAAYAQAGRSAEAVTEMRTAVRLAPGEASMHALLSQVLAGIGQLQEAIAEQKAALSLDPRDPDGWNNLGVLEVRSGTTAQARADFQRALQLEPSHAQARANLSRLPPG
jgi:Flp pilus assembly protein TadD/mono/diheme cytochrome c family protein